MEYATGIDISVYDWFRDDSGNPLLNPNLTKEEADEMVAKLWDEIYGDYFIIDDPIRFDLVCSRSDFVIIRFLDSLCRLDKAAKLNWKGVGQYKKPRAPYCNWVTGMSASALAIQFYNEVNNLGDGLGELPPILDYEPTVAAKPDDIYALLSEIHNKFLHPQGVMVYSSKNFWSNLSPAPAWMNENWIKRWVASWTTAGNPTMPPGWDTWNFWQYTSNGDGASYGLKSSDADINRFNGTITDLQKWLRTESRTLEQRVQTLENWIPINTSEHDYLIAEIARLEQRIAKLETPRCQNILKKLYRRK